jgi:hypothetical protein
MTLTPDPDNPNRVAPADKARMAKSLAEFGDLSGVILNRRTGLLVGGHQRTEVLDGAVIEAADLPEREADGTVARGFLIRDGRRYSLRVVDWTPRKAKAALLAANRFGRVGTDDGDALAKVLREVQADSGFDMDLTGYADKALAELIGPDGDADAGDGGAFDVGQQFGVIVICKTEAEQRAAYESLLGLGYSVKVVCV